LIKNIRQHELTLINTALISGKLNNNKGKTMTNKQKISLLSRLNNYKEYLIINMTDKKVYNDTWQVSDINRLNKDLRVIKKLINNN
jgi:hypothetical protein